MSAKKGLTSIKPPQERSSIDLVDKCESMMKEAYEFILHFPKYQQHSLGADIRGTMGRLLYLVHRCARRFHKKTTLEDLVVEIDYLRSQVRVAYNSKYIDPAKYISWAQMNDEIGRMIGGWHRSLSEKPAAQRGGKTARSDGYASR